MPLLPCFGCFMPTKKDYKSRLDDDVLIKREIAKIKMKYVF